MNINIAEGNIPHELKTHHDHPGDPEKEDIEASDKHRGRIEGLKICAHLRPSKRGERPESGRKPRVQHVGIADKLASATSRASLRRLPRNDRASLFAQHE